MKRPQLPFFLDGTSLYFVLVWVVMICMSPPGLVRANRLPEAGGSSSCSDSIDSCKKPVKFISNINGCYTFACEYGAATQHNIHISAENDVKTALQMAKESGH